MAKLIFRGIRLLHLPKYVLLSNLCLVLFFFSPFEDCTWVRRLLYPQRECFWYFCFLLFITDVPKFVSYSTVIHNIFFITLLTSPFFSLNANNYCLLLYSQLGFEHVSSTSILLLFPSSSFFLSFFC